jgi:hypothetical protein
MISLIYQPVDAQVNWWKLDSGSSVSLELHKIHYNRQDLSAMETSASDFLGFYNLVGFLDARIQIDPSIAIIADIPFASYDVDIDPIVFEGEPYWWYISQSEDQTAIGNPMIGIEYTPPLSSTIIRFWVRLPLASEENDEALSNGILGAYDRLEAFLPEISTIGINGGIRHNSERSVLETQLLLGPAFMIPSSGDPELFLDGSTYVGARTEHFKAGIALSGRLLLTEDYDFGDRLTGKFGLVGALRLGQFEPGVHFKYNLDEAFRELIDYTYGINLTVHFAPKESTPRDWEE